MALFKLSAYFGPKSKGQFSMQNEFFTLFIENRNATIDPVGANLK